MRVIKNISQYIIPISFRMYQFINTRYLPPSPSTFELTKSSFNLSWDHAQAFFSVLRHNFGALTYTKDIDSLKLRELFSKRYKSTRKSFYLCYVFNEGQRRSTPGSICLLLESSPDNQMLIYFIRIELMT